MSALSTPSKVGASQFLEQLFTPHSRSSISYKQSPWLHTEHMSLTELVSLIGGRLIRCHHLDTTHSAPTIVTSGAVTRPRYYQQTRADSRGDGFYAWVEPKVSGGVFKREALILHPLCTRSTSHLTDKEGKELFTIEVDKYMCERTPLKFLQLPIEELANIIEDFKEGEALFFANRTFIGDPAKEAKDTSTVSFIETLTHQLIHKTVVTALGEDRHDLFKASWMPMGSEIADILTRGPVIPYHPLK